ncbi:CAP domain-containing protein [uncultured Winogradskyella sp.]|uniref:CAP domain-containing protein n=1 Tax=uncultured Winogradskyella sp. TaxID=395353 RepID=UPI0026146FB9|nr:CAP domain-containing protein [uncultured Winogradskyella sp.]
MRTYSVSIIIILILFTQSCTKDSVDDNFISNQIDLSLANETNHEVANAILLRINSYRQDLNLNSIQLDGTYATAYAVEHTKYMIENNTISHDFFYKRKNGLKAVGAIEVAENVAYGYSSAESAFNAWLNSLSHKRVIEGNFTHVGIGVLVDSNDKPYYTCLFYN